MDLATADATAQAEFVRSGQASPLELVDAAIERIERINPSLNAVIHERFDKARAEARAPLPDGPFRGVPFLIKDLVCQTEGDPYHCGAEFLKRLGYVADHDTYLAEKFRAAGFVFVGRTNTPEFGSTITTEPLAYGPCRNPWNLGHSTGGSSGGSASAVAAGLTPAAHANDGGGSIRIPASECGLVGLKPTRARVSQGPDTGEAWMGATVEGSVSRTVRDTAAILDAIAGFMPGDPYPAPHQARPYADEVGVDPGRLKVGFYAGPSYPGVPVDAECVAAVEGAAKLLASLGHRVEGARPDALCDPDFQGRFVGIVAAASAADLDHWGEVIGRPITSDDVEPGNWRFAETGRALSANEYLGHVGWMHSYQRRMASWWADDGFDVLVTPTIALPPPPIGYLSDPEQGMTRLVQMLQYTAQFNVTGQPAVSLPLHWTPDGLPVGVQFVAAFGREDLLVRLAAQLEQAAPWAARRPPVHA